MTDIRNPSDTGLTIWITGFSGAGKSTAAQLLYERYLSHGHRPILFHGDRLRAILGREEAHAPEQRHELSWIYARLCQELAAQGAVVICATISMFHDVRAWNRRMNPRYCEIYLRVPLAQRSARNAKALYSNGQEGQQNFMVGRDAPAEEPLFPDAIIENWGKTTATATVDAIWRIVEGVEGVKNEDIP